MMLNSILHRAAILPLKRMGDWKMLGGILFTVTFFYFCQTTDLPVTWLWLPVLVVMVFYFREGLWKIQTLQWVHILLAFYAIWVLLSLLCHYFAMSMLNPNSYITVHRNQIGWGISPASPAVAGVGRRTQATHYRREIACLRGNGWLV